MITTFNRIKSISIINRPTSKFNKQQGLKYKLFKQKMNRNLIQQDLQKDYDQEFQFQQKHWSIPQFYRTACLYVPLSHLAIVVSSFPYGYYSDGYLYAIQRSFDYVGMSQAGLGGMYIAYAMTDGHYRVSEKQLISRNKKIMLGSIQIFSGVLLIKFADSMSLLSYFNFMFVNLYLIIKDRLMCEQLTCPQQFVSVKFNWFAFTFLLVTYLGFSIIKFGAIRKQNYNLVEFYEEEVEKNIENYKKEEQQLLDQFRQSQKLKQSV